MNEYLSFQRDLGGYFPKSVLLKLSVPLSPGLTTAAEALNYSEMN